MTNKRVLKDFGHEFPRSGWAWAGLILAVVDIVFFPQNWWWLLPALAAAAICTTFFRVAHRYAEEIKRLKIRPYDEKHRALAQQKLDSLKEDEKNIIEYILHHGKPARHELRIEFKFDGNK